MLPVSSLNLEDNNLTDPGLSAIANVLDQIPGLKELDLRSATDDFDDDDDDDDDDGDDDVDVISSAVAAPGGDDGRIGSGSGCSGIRACLIIFAFLQYSARMILMAMQQLL